MNALAFENRFIAIWFGVLLVKFFCFGFSWLFDLAVFFMVIWRNSIHNHGYLHTTGAMKQNVHPEYVGCCCFFEKSAESPKWSTWNERRAEQKPHLEMYNIKPVAILNGKIKNISLNEDIGSAPHTHIVWITLESIQNRHR